MRTAIADVLIVLGVLLVVLGGVAVLRLPDVLARANAATKAAGLGLASILAGAAVAIGTGDAYLKLGLAIVLQFATAPVAGHVLARAAYRADPEHLTTFLATDDLATGEEVLAARHRAGLAVRRDAELPFGGRDAARGDGGVPPPDPPRRDGTS